MNADGSTKTQITFDGVGQVEPVVGDDARPARRSRSSARARDGYFTLLTVNPDGTGVTELAGSAADLAWHIIGYDWSPDGTKIALSSWLDTPTGCNGVNVTADGHLRLRRRGEDADRTSPTRPPSKGPFEQYPVWSPDGTKIAFSARRDRLPERLVSVHALLDLPDERRRQRRREADDSRGCRARSSATSRRTTTRPPGSRAGWDTARVHLGRRAESAVHRLRPRSPRTRTGTRTSSSRATATSGLTVAFSATGGCILNGVTVHLTAAGSCTVTARRPGIRAMRRRRGSPRRSRSRAVQTISFDSLPRRRAGDPDFTVSAPRLFGPARLVLRQRALHGGSRPSVHVTGTGSCTITCVPARERELRARPGRVQTFLIAPRAAATPSGHCRVPRG